VAIGALLVTVAIAGALAAGVMIFGSRGPSCADLTTPAQLDAEANAIYGAQFAPGDEIKGGPEDNPRTLARYRRAETRIIRPAIAAACARHSSSFRPRRSVVDKLDTD
jgi:hypothetical protein